MKRQFLALVVLACATICPAQQRLVLPAQQRLVLPAQQRLVLIDQDGAGPGGSDQMAMLALLQAPDVRVLGITIVTGDAWRDEEMLHTLRMLELTGHSDVPVVRGAVFPLVRNEDQTRMEEALDGKVAWLGAWGGVTVPSPGATTPASHGPYEIPPMPEGVPTTKALDEDAAHFLIRQVRAHPHQVTIYAAGPLTNIALAVSIDPEFASLTKGIVVMGGSLNPQTNDPQTYNPGSADLEFSDPRHEFNFWFDPEAAHIVLRADWPRIDVTTEDISTKAPFTPTDAGRDFEIADARRALHRRMEPAPHAHVGRARSVRLDRSRDHHQRSGRLHGGRPEPRSRATATHSPGPKR